MYFRAQSVEQGEITYVLTSLSTVLVISGEFQHVVYLVTELWTKRLEGDMVFSNHIIATAEKEDL